MLTSLVIFAGGASLVLKGLDPIDLIAGREVPGQTNFSVTYLRHEYHFATAAHKEEFVKNPIKFAVQNGGACGKMGALTGKGSPDRWAVSKGKIFLFASDGCRTTFLANESSYFAPTAAAPLVTSSDKEAATGVFNEMLQAHGGDAVKEAKSIEWTYETPYKDQGKDKIWKSKYAVLGPTKFAQWEEWDAGQLFFVVDGKRDADGKPGQIFAIHPGERRELTALFARNPMGILLGTGGMPVKPLAGRHGFVMVRDDLVFTVLLDSSKIEQIEFRDRYSGPIADVSFAFSDYEVYNGIALPRSHRVRVGKGDWGAKKTIADLKVNAAEPSVFASALAK